MRHGTSGAAAVFALLVAGAGAHGDPRGLPPLPGLAALVESPTTGPEAPRFEVVSVKRNKAGAGATIGSAVGILPGGQVRDTNVTLQMLIRQAYGLRMTDQVVGGPSWIDSYGFDVAAKPPASVTVAQSRLSRRPRRRTAHRELIPDP